MISLNVGNLGIKYIYEIEALLIKFRLKLNVE